VLFKRFLSFCLLALGAVILQSVCVAAPLMVEKNLFAQDRKAPPPESAVTVAPGAKPSMAISNIQLDGVMIQGNNRKAIVRLKNQAGADKKKGQSPFVTVREGQQVGDYRVSKIEGKSISLEKDGQTFVIGLFAENKVVTPPAPPVAVAAPANQPPGGVPNQPGMPPQQMGGAVPQFQQGQEGQVGMPPPSSPGVPGYIDPAQQNAGQIAPEPGVQEAAPAEEEED
jgi:hypothetical protein